AAAPVPFPRRLSPGGAAGPDRRAPSGPPEPARLAPRRPARSRVDRAPAAGAGPPAPLPLGPGALRRPGAPARRPAAEVRPQPVAARARRQVAPPAPARGLLFGRRLRDRPLARRAGGVAVARLGHVSRMWRRPCPSPTRQRGPSLALRASRAATRRRNALSWGALFSPAVAGP